MGYVFMRKGHESSIRLFRFDFFDFSLINNSVGSLSKTNSVLRTKMTDDLKAVITPKILDLFKNHKTSNSFAKSNNLFRFSCIKIFEND